MTATTTTGGPTVGQLAGQAAESVRAINHLTRPGVSALTGPAELDTVVADLACLAARLPQLLAQLAGWLHTEQRHGRLRVDALAPHTDSATAVAAAIEALTQASDCAQHTGRTLDAAHQTLAHLAATSGDNDDTDDDLERS
jgi:hypothetical protein